MNTAADIIDAIRRAQKILVCGHVRPDGDSIGATLAMRRICQKLGKSADAVCDSEKPAAFDFLPDYELFCSPKYNNYDLFIAVDCANAKRLGAYIVQLDSAADSISIDHHSTNEEYAKTNIVDGASSSTCALLFDLFSQSGIIDRDIATMLYTGLSTDTGHFMHSNTDAKVFYTAAKLCEYGIDVSAINHAIYCNRSLRRTKLTSRALDSIRMYAEGRVALMTVGLDDLAECGCKSEDTEGLIDFVSAISGVLISISMCEQDGGYYRVSFRAVSCDVSAAAATFGGGGHKLAAGCIITGDRYEVTEKVVSAAICALNCK